MQIPGLPLTSGLDWGWSRHLNLNVLRTTVRTLDPGPPAKCDFLLLKKLLPPGA